MLGIGTFSEGDVRAVRRQKVEFAEMRWMEIRSVLRRKSANGTRPLRQSEVADERLNQSRARTR